MIVRPARSLRDFAAVAGLLRAFVTWHYQRHAADRAIIDSYFDPDTFAAELASLPGEFAPPAGELLVADDGGRIVGCVALRPCGEGVCEMKRMFVSPDCHGKGAGLRLATAIVEKARALGYRRMLLDTGPGQREAQALYRKLGFRDAAPSEALAPELRDWLVFMELNLSG